MPEEPVELRPYDADCDDEWHDDYIGKPGSKSQCPTCSVIETVGNNWSTYHFEKGKV